MPIVTTILHPRHVIGYLLERGALDTSTLFARELNVKPPSFNKTQEAEEEISPRHRHTLQPYSYNYAPAYVPQ